MNLLVLGDSHAQVFATPDFQGLLPNCRFEVVWVGGATVSGLANPNSVTGAMETYHVALAAAARPDAIVTLIGEVDTGFVIWYRAAKYGEPVSAMLELAVAGYASLLDAAAQAAPPVAISAALPTIRDGTDWGEVANARRDVTATQIERTQLTLQFNLRVSELCESRGYGFVDLDGASLGPGGVVRDSLRNADPADHHYDAHEYAAMLAPRLRAALSALPRGTTIMG